MYKQFPAMKIKIHTSFHFFLVNVLFFVLFIITFAFLWFPVSLIINKNIYKKTGRKTVKTFGLEIEYEQKI